MAGTKPPMTTTYDPAGHATGPLRTTTHPELKAEKRNGNMKALLAIVGTVTTAATTVYLAHGKSEEDNKAKAIDTREKVLLIEQKLESHITTSDERHGLVKTALDEIKAEQKTDRERRAKETDAMLDALRVPKEKRPR